MKLNLRLSLKSKIRKNKAFSIKYLIPAIATAIVLKSIKRANTYKNNNQ